jgi:hypothetical protein
MRHCAISRRPSFEAFWPGFLAEIGCGNGWLMGAVPPINRPRPKFRS